jgi:hypothetical protein
MSENVQIKDILTRHIQSTPYKEKEEQLFAAVPL